MPKIERAILSVTDKTGIVELAKVLASFKVEILSTGGTAKVLRENNIPVKEVSEHTGFPEVMDGRLKTLHPILSGGILAKRSEPSHLQAMKELGISPIDMVVVNLYPFEQTIAKPNCTLDEALSQIDIGGPTMLRAASKNYQDVTVLVDPQDYQKVIQELNNNEGNISSKTNFELAVKVFQTTAFYDGVIARHLSEQISSFTPAFQPRVSLQFEKLQDLRYGENPHQKAAVYKEIPTPPGELVFARQLHGKELSFNNYIDLEAALNLVREFNEPACIIIKHTNPCGVAIGKNLSDAFVRSKECDPVSCFGGIIGLNRSVDVATANAIGETFFECIIAPQFDDDAVKILQSKKNLRLMTLNPFERPQKETLDYKRIGGGLLIQQRDTAMADLNQCPVPTQRKPTSDELAQLAFAWKVVKHIKSNAILFAKDGQIVGVGAGQMSRVDSVKLAAVKATKPLKGAVMASDAFFPFRDGIDEASRHGITAIVQPGGSLRDVDAIKAADEAGLAMVFTGMRHFKH